MKKRLLIIGLVLILLALPHFLAVETFAGQTPESTAADTSPTETEAPVVDYTYQPAVEGVVSSYYHIDRENGFITGVAPRTYADKLASVCLPAGAELSADRMATGTLFTVPASGDSPAQTLTVIVTGDLNGDGGVSITDMLILKSRILGTELSAAAEAAADINYDGVVSITDFLKAKAVVLGLEHVVSGRPAGTQPEDPILLMCPQTTAKLPAEAAGGAAFVSGDEVLVSVDGEGNVTALGGEGSAFVYALDPEGKLVSRVMVTVLEEKMEVSLNCEACTLLPGATRELTASFNHPFTEVITWTSSAPETVSVDENGVLTAHNVGTAVVSAAIGNGSTAEVNVTVMPPITTLEIEKSLYKVKPGDSRTLVLVTDPPDTQEEFIWQSSDPAIATVSNDGTVTGVDYGTVTVTVTGKYSGLTASCEVKICNVKQVALTFDDGPSIYTDRLLDFLKEHDIKVTFFLVANRITYFKDETIREVQEGHEIGYHSFAHDIQTGLSSERITSDFVKSNQTLKELTGAEFTLWRTPGGAYNQRVLNAVELPHILWSLDTLDWQSLNAKKVCSKILMAGDGSIVLIHDLHKTSVEGAIMAMEQMIEGDYEFVTVTELLSRDGTPPENSVNYNSGRS